MFSYPKFYAEDGNGDPLRGGKLYSYKAGTSTAKVTYSEGTLTTANDNPTILNSRGEATVYLSGTYKFILKDSDDNIIWTLDDIEGANEAYATYYYPNADAADQGATGNSDTIKYAVDTISTDNGTIFLRHNSGSATTTYTLTTSETIGSNINLVIEKGALLAGAGTLTMTPDNIVASPNQKIFTSSTSPTVVFTGYGSSVYAEWWGAVSDGTTDSSAAIQAAISSYGAVGAGAGILQLLGGTYLSDKIAMYAYWVVKGVGKRWTTIKLKDSTNDNLLDYSADYCVFTKLKDLSLYGNYSNQTGTSNGIYAYRTGTDITSTGRHHIENIEIYEFLDSGIYWGGNTGQTSFMDIDLHHNRKYGLNLYGGDSYFTSVTTSFNQLGGFYVTGPMHQWATCKSYWDGQNTDTVTTYFGSSYQPGWQFRDTGSTSVAGNTLSSCNAQESYAHGLYSEGGDNISISSFVADSNSKGTANTYSGIYLKDSTYINISGTFTNYLFAHQKYGLYVDSGCDKINANITTADQVTATYYNGVASTAEVAIASNGGLESGKNVMIGWGNLTAGVENAIAFAWQNPHPYEIIVTQVLVETDTAAGAAAIMDVGRTTSAAGTSDNFFDGININTASVYSSTCEYHNGTNAVSAPIAMNAKAGTNDYITGKILSAAASSLVGQYWILYVRRR